MIFFYVICEVGCIIFIDWEMFDTLVYYIIDFKVYFFVFYEKQDEFLMWYGGKVYDIVKFQFYVYKNISCCYGL